MLLHVDMCAYIYIHISNIRHIINIYICIHIVYIYMCSTYLYTYICIYMYIYVYIYIYICEYPTSMAGLPGPACLIAGYPWVLSESSRPAPPKVLLLRVVGGCWGLSSFESNLNTASHPQMSRGQDSMYTA